MSTYPSSNYSGGSGMGGGGHGEIYIVEDGVTYSREQWWRKQVLETLQRIERLLTNDQSS